jgi:hypothetical protein
MPANGREEGREQIAALVAPFAGNEEHYRSADFEASTRELVIKGIFDALGWD